MFLHNKSMFLLCYEEVSLSFLIGNLELVLKILSKLHPDVQWALYGDVLECDLVHPSWRSRRRDSCHIHLRKTASKACDRWNIDSASLSYFLYVYMYYRVGTLAECPYLTAIRSLFPKCFLPQFSQWTNVTVCQ